MTNQTDIALSLFFFLAVLLLVLIAFFFIFRAVKSPRRARPAAAGKGLVRAEENPIISPGENPWENAAVFNPGAVYVDGKVHLFYRALGDDGISRIGYAVSDDGVRFTRFPNPAFVMKTPPSGRFKSPIPEKNRYNPEVWKSGGGWGGSEDPRVAVVDGRLYMTFGVFESWESLRIALTSLPLASLKERHWDWAEHFFISPPNETNKNWVLFPEKIRGKFAMLHALTPRICIAYADSLDMWRTRPIQSDNRRGGHEGRWDAFIRGAAAPPLKTKRGWLLLYHGMNPEKGPGYRVGAMLLDKKDPTKVTCYSNEPVLSPETWYENDWKPGVVYASGAVIKDGTLFVYYGGGDKTVSVATAPLDAFVQELSRGGHPALSKTTSSWLA